MHTKLNTMEGEAMAIKEAIEKRGSSLKVTQN
jgi:hypothetical protein